MEPDTNMANEIQILTDLVLDTKKDISEIKEMTVKNTTVLEEHQRRSTASETRITRLEKSDQMWKGFFKIAGAILGVLGTIAVIIQTLRHP